MYIPLSVLEALQAALAAPSSTTASIGHALGWDSRAAWGEIKILERLGYVEKVNAIPPFDTAKVVWRARSGLAATIAQERLLEAQNAATPPEDIRYIRCGDWCACGRSQIGISSDFEPGISAYTARRNGNAWQPTDRCFWRKNLTTTDGPSPWYLLAGTVIGQGSDDEPLLEDVTAVGVLAWNSDGLCFDMVPDAVPPQPHFLHDQCSGASNEQ